jgi:hypothetical protein
MQYDLLVNRHQRTCLCATELVDEKEGEIEFVLLGQESGLIAAETDNNEKYREILLA